MGGGFRCGGRSYIKEDRVELVNECKCGWGLRQGPDQRMNWGLWLVNGTK